MAWTRKLCFFVLSLLFVACGEKSIIPTSSSLILITIDTLRADHLSCYGYPKKTSPFLARMAQEGIIFTHAFSPCSHTSPAHASLFTSLYPSEHLVLENGMPLPDDALTLAEYLRDRGYKTAGFISAGFLKELSQGFQTFWSPLSYSPADNTLFHALKWLSKQEKDTPFFLWVHLFDIHEWHVPKHFHQDYLQKAQKLPPKGKKLLSYLQTYHGLDTVHYPGKMTPLDVVNHYDAQVLYIDEALETFWSFCQPFPFSKKTLWIITADHGEGLGNHQFLGHGKYLYDEQIHIPLILSPAKPKYAGTQIDALVSLIGIFPTALDLFSLPKPFESPKWRGRSLLPLLQGSIRDLHPHLFFERRPLDDKRRRLGWKDERMVAWRTLQHKYIYHSELEDEYYDLSKDPWEKKNLIFEKDVDEKKLRKRMETFLGTLKPLSLIPPSINPEHTKSLKALGYL